MSESRLYVDIHVIQTVPPSCVNRDDTGSPKSAVYGGVTRARVSSQAWKHAMRKYFKQLFTAEEIGIRTRKAVDLVTGEIVRLNPELGREKAEKMAVKALDNAGVKIKEKDEQKRSEALFFMSMGQARGLAQLAIEKETDKKRYKEALKVYPGYDMALFGRMVASDPSLNYDAAAQVAHSISTHAVQTEYDYFTAVDDMAPEDSVGAGHLGTIEFNSSTLYRYATVNVRELHTYLGADTAKVVRGFAEAFIRSMPDGKQNSCANLTRPDAVYLTVRRDQPVNLCGAFERAILSEEGYAAPSVRRLMEYAEESYRDYVDAPELVLAVGQEMKQYMETVSVPELLNQLTQYLSACEDKG